MENESGKKMISIVAGIFHQDVIDETIRAAQNAIHAEGYDSEVFVVPGAYEIPLVVKRLFDHSTTKAVVALGAIEKGETLHGEVMGHVVHQSLMDLQLCYDRPIGMGIIGPGATPKQMHERKTKIAQEAVRAVMAVLRLNA